MSMDPQQRILLHTAQAALDDAGYVQDSTPSFQRSSMGCYIGLATGDYTDNLRDEIDAFYSPGRSPPFVKYVYLALTTWHQELYERSIVEDYLMFTNSVGHA